MRTPRATQAKRHHEDPAQILARTQRKWAAYLVYVHSHGTFPYGPFDKAWIADGTNICYELEEGRSTDLIANGAVNSIKQDRVLAVAAGTFFCPEYAAYVRYHFG